VGIVRNSFQVMVGIGTFLAALAVWFLWARWRHGEVPGSKWFLRGVVIAGPLAVVALIAGWIVTEVGRQPWIVYELMRTEDAVTGASGIPVGYATLVVVYIALYAVAYVLLRRIGREGPEAELEKGARIEALP
jgi:cytochrome d ubiquinol oxidase subunit I